MARLHAAPLVLLALLAAGCQEPESNTAATPGSAPTTTKPASTTLPGDPPSGGKTVTLPSGLRYDDLRVGDGAIAESGKMVFMHYTGWLTDGTSFDTSRDDNVTYDFRLGTGRVIRGWDEGIVGMRVGGKRKLVVPPNLAYGERGYPPVIPANATLVFDVELMNVR